MPGRAQVDVHVAQLDMQDLDAVAGFLPSLPVRFQAVDILVNNAGLALGKNAVQENDMKVGSPSCHGLAHHYAVPASPATCIRTCCKPLSWHPVQLAADPAADPSSASTVHLLSCQTLRCACQVGFCIMALMCAAAKALVVQRTAASTRRLRGAVS